MRLLNKYFQPPEKSAEREFADTIASNGSICQTRFFELRVGFANWKTPGYANLPKKLDKFPPYWCMPWREKKRTPLGKINKFARFVSFPFLAGKFRDLMFDILKNGYKEMESIKADLLIHPTRGKIFIYTDGNRRLGILSCTGLININFDVQQTVHRDCLIGYRTAQEGIKKGYFSKADIYKWFDHPFDMYEKIPVS